MKYKLLFACLAAVCVRGYAVGQQLSGQKSATWQSYYKDEKVEIEYRYADCDIPSQGSSTEKIFLQFKNLTNAALKVSYELELQMGNNCFNCAGGDREFQKEVLLQPKQIITGICSENNPKVLEIFSKFRNYPNNSVLENHKVKNVIITEINNK